MKLINDSRFISLLNEVIQSIQVGDYEVNDKGIMIVHVTECDYEHYIEDYNIQAANKENKHFISIDLMALLEKRHGKINYGG